MEVQLHAFLTSALDGVEWSASTPGRFTWYLLDRKLSGSQSRSERCSEEKNSQALPALETPALPPPSIMQPVAKRYTTELSRLLQVYTELLQVNSWLFF
jgi:hypothetical protein